jgi:hypothetical protein
VNNRSPEAPIALFAGAKPHIAPLLGLVFGLRERGVAITTADVHASVTLLKSNDTWDREELFRVLAAIFVKRPRDRTLFAIEFARHYDSIEPIDPVKTDATQEGGETPFVSPSPEIPAAKFRFRESWGSLRSVIGSLMRRIGRLGRQLHHHLSWILASGAILAIVITLMWVHDSFLRLRMLGRASYELTAVSVTAAVVIASALLLLGLIAWRGWALGRAVDRRRTDFASRLASVDGSGDETVFRVGALGGDQQRFLQSDMATQVAELFSYRRGEPEISTLDVQATVAAHVRGEDPSSIVHERQRQLPVVLLLVDATSSSLQWHTLAYEFEAALSARGVAHERITFQGSFFESRDGRTNLSGEGLYLESAVTAPGWTVTCVFGEVQKLSAVDRGLLHWVQENGPVLFFELRHPRLWDARHRLLSDGGITVLPATAPYLLEGLARIFAPDRATAADTFDPIDRIAARNPAANEITLEALGADAVDWATECALVQPISYALAETLRRAHPELAGPSGQLEYSRLAALPGSWTGAEGLRFEPGVRCLLLNLFSARPAKEREAVTAVIDAAFADEPIGETASALWRYARAQVLVFGAAADEAFSTINEIADQGLINPDDVDRLFAHLRLPSQPTDPRRIVLPAEPVRAATRRRLLSRRTNNLGPERPLPIARWIIGLPESRVRFLDNGEGNSALSTSGFERPTGSAFLPGGRYVIVDGQLDSSVSAGLVLVDVVLGTRGKIGGSWSTAAISGIWTAREVQLAVIAVRGSPLFIVRSDFEPSNELGAEHFTVQMLPGTDIGSDDDAPAVAVSPDGNLIALCRSDGQLMLADPNSKAEPQLVETGARATTLSFPSNERLFAGLANGDVIAFSIEERRAQGMSIVFHLELPATAIAPVSVADPMSPLIAGLPDGRIILTPTSQTSSAMSDQYRQVKLAWVSRRVAPFPDKGVVASEGAGGSPTGLSIAVLGQEGECEIVGLPFVPSGPAKTDVPVFAPMSLLEKDIRPRRDGMRVLNIAAQSRRLAIVRSSALEIRPLVYHLPTAEAPVNGSADR